MNWAEMTEDEQAAHYRLAAAMEAEGQHLGPTSPLSERALCEDCDATPVPQNAVLTEWVIVQAWTDMETGESWLTKVAAPKMPGHHITGLLASFE